MASGENMMDLALKITADPSQAEAAVNHFTETVKESSVSVAQSLRAQGYSADEVVQIMRQLDFSAAEAGAQVKAAFGAAAESSAGLNAELITASQLTRDWIHRVNDPTILPALQRTREGFRGVTSGISQSLQGLRSFRMLMYSTLGIISFGFYITEWQRVVEYIEQASQALGGFSKEQRDLFAQQVKFNNQLIAGNPAELRQNVQNAIAAYQNIEDQVRKVKEQIAATHQTTADFMSLTATAGASFRDEGSDISGLWQKLKELQQQLALADTAEAKAQLALAEYQQHHRSAAKAVHDHASAIDKLALAQQRVAEAMAIARGELPPYIQQIDRVRAAIAQQEAAYAGTLQILKQYLELQQKGFATPAQMGFGLPNAVPISTQIEMTHQLTAAQRAALPSERELALANAELAREYPSLTNAERQEWAQVMLTSEAYRQHIDESARMVHSVHQQRDAWLDLFPVLDQLAEKHQRAVQVEQQFAHAMGQNIATAIVYGNSIGQAVEKALKATLASIAAEALVRALFSTGFGFLMLAEGNFGAAAQAFTAAAVFGGIGGTAAVVGAAVPGGGGAAAAANARGVSPQSSLGGSPGVAGNEGSPGVAGGARHNTYLNFYGGQLTDTKNLQNLIEAINAGGQSGTVRLNIAGSSHTIPNPVY
jgi:hypothetical protein